MCAECGQSEYHRTPQDSIICMFNILYERVDYGLVLVCWCINEIILTDQIDYNINVMRQTACLVVIPVKVNSFAYLFNCTTVGRTSD